MATATRERTEAKVVSHSDWLAAHKAFLAKEKELTHLRDEVSRQRRQLPWEKVEKPYSFDGPNGKVTLADLFGGCNQLVVYHFMLGPGWKEGCPSCSFISDQFDSIRVHMQHRDTNLVAISRAPWSEIEKFKARMGWKFPWVSSSGNDFNFDYKVSFSKADLEGDKPNYNFDTTKFTEEEGPGASVFYRKGGDIFHTYSTYERGLDILLSAYNFIDLTPKGRDEEGLPWPMAWVRHHDKYEDTSTLEPTKALSAKESCCSGK